MKIYVAKNGQQHGPFEMEGLQGKVTEGTFSSTDLAWMKGWPAWQPLSSISELELPPPPPPSGGVTAGPANIALSHLSAGVRRDIDSLDVAAVWKQRFHLMEKIGWGKGMNYWNLGQLNSSERFLVWFNFWAVFLGPAYYLAKGMWLKAVILAGIDLVALALGGIPIIAVHLACGHLVNYDYYLFKVYGKALY